jgi:hypothetical protein
MCRKRQPERWSWTASKMDSGLDYRRRMMERGGGSRRTALRTRFMGRAGETAVWRWEGSISGEWWSGVGEPANGALNQVYGGDWAERQRWAGWWRVGSDSILSGAGMENLVKSFCHTHLYTGFIYTADRTVGRRCYVKHNRRSPHGLRTNKWKQTLQLEPWAAVKFSTQPD